VVSFLSGDVRIIPPGGINFVAARGREASATIFATIAYVREHHLGNGAFKKKS
jgi:hypothetical protein